jgi:hypothetical protein
MLTEERVIHRPIASPPIEELHLDPVQGSPRPEFSLSSLLARLVLVAIGFGLVFIGWMLMMSVILAFIGLPMFIFGLALMQAQER